MEYEHVCTEEFFEAELESKEFDSKEDALMAYCERLTKDSTIVAEVSCSARYFSPETGNEEKGRNRPKIVLRGGTTYKLQHLT